MPDTTDKPQHRNGLDSFNSTNTTLVDALCEHASSMPQPQISNLLRAFLKSMGDATASGESMTQAVACAKASEMAWNSRKSASPVHGDEILQWNLQYVNILMGCDDLASVTFPPSGLEDLIPPKTNIMPSKTMAELFSKVALLYLRQRGPQSLQMANNYLHLALDTFIMTKAYDRNSLLLIAQDLNDVLELQGNLGLASEHFSGGSTLPQWVTDGVEKGGMSIAKQWCEIKKFDIDQFYEAKEPQKLSPLAVATIEEHRGAFTAMLRFTARTVTPYRMSCIASKLLPLAADTCNSEFAKDLLDLGAKADTLDEHHHSSLHRLVLCRKYGDLGGFKMIKMLLDKDLSILDIEDENGKTALTLACEAEYLLKIKELLKYGANPNKQDSHLCSPFFIACSRGNDKIIQVFLANDETEPHMGTLEINAFGPRRQTPLIAAVKFAARGNSKGSGALNSIKLLKQHGADPDQQDCENLSALDYAKIFKKTQIKRILKPTTMGSKFSLVSRISSSRIDHVSPLYSSHGHTEDGESSTEGQFSTAGPVKHDEQSEALQPKVSMGEMTRSQGAPVNVCQTSSDIHIVLMGTGTDVVEPSGQGKPETLSPSSRKGKCKSVESEIIAVSKSTEVISLESSDSEIIADGHTSQKHDNSDDAAGMYEEGETSDDFDDDFSVSASDDDFEDVVASGNILSPIKNSTHVGASGPRQCPNQNTHNYNGSSGHMSPSNETSGHGLSASRSSSTNANHPQKGKKQTTREGPNQPEGGSDGEDEPEGESAGGPYACVYCKAHPLLFPRCIQEAFDTISRLKQHLLRKHYVQFYCPRCQKTFAKQELRDRHISVGGCPQRAADARMSMRMTEKQRKGLRKCPKGQRGDQFQQWYSLFKLLFPRRDPPPATPWADPASSVLLTLRQEFREGITMAFVARIRQADDTEVRSILGDYFDECLDSNSEERQSGAEDLDGVSAQQSTSVPAAAPSPCVLGNDSQMHGDQHGAAYPQPPSVPQTPLSPGSISASDTPRFNQRSIPTIGHAQQPSTSSYLHPPNQPVGVPAGYQYQPPSHFHHNNNNNNNNNPANLATHWPSQGNQSLPGAFSQAQGFSAAENNFLQIPQQNPGAFSGNLHAVPPFTSGTYNNSPMYSNGNFGISPQQLYPINPSFMFRPNEGLQGGFQGQPQAGQGGFQGSPQTGQGGFQGPLQAGQGSFQGPSQASQGSPTSDHQSGDTDMFSEGSADAV